MSADIYITAGTGTDRLGGGPVRRLVEAREMRPSEGSATVRVTVRGRLPVLAVQLEGHVEEIVGRGPEESVPATVSD